MTSDQPLPRKGTQSVERTIRIIKAVSEHSEFGWQLSDLARYCNLDKSTVFRILGCLQRERVVRRSKRNERYMPGPLLYEMGLMVPGYSDFSAIARERLSALSKRIGMMVSLYYRSGDESVCAVVTGSGATRNFLRPASRRPLLGSAAGVCMLLALPPREAKDIMRRNIDALSVHRKNDIAKLKKMYLTSKREGMTIYEGNLIPGIHGIAIPVLDAEGSPIGSVVISGTAEEMPRATFHSMHALLKVEADALSALAGTGFPDVVRKE